MKHNISKTLFFFLAIAIQGVAIASVPINDIGNSIPITQRIAQLERIVEAQGDVITQLQQQVSDQQRGIENLYGQFQQNQHELNQRQTSQAEPEISENSDIKNNKANNVQKEADSTVLSGDETTDYNTAVSLALHQKQYDQAISLLQAFIKKYPNSTYQANANYWLGQLYYNKKELDTAAHYFAYVVKHYPQSSKSADSMLKVGLIMQAQGQTDKAKVIYQQVERSYKGTQAAQEAQKRLAAW